MGKAMLSRKQMGTLCLLCCLVYFVSYLTRLNYAVCMVEIQAALRIGKNTAGLPLTASFLSYGLGQIICGFLGDRHEPRKMICTGLTGSALCNLLAVSLPRMEIMIPVWFINGLFQSMLWPPLVRIMAESLDEDWYRKGCVWVSLSSSGATVMLYLLTPLFIRISGWKTVFYLAVAAGIAAAFVWFWNTGRMFGGRAHVEVKEGARAVDAGNKSADGEGKAAKAGISAANGEGIAASAADMEEPAAPAETAPKKAKAGAVFAGVPIIAILMSIILHGTLKDGITTWMPVYMTEMFGMSSSQSILSTAVLPVCSVISTLLSSALLYRLKNEMLTAALLFGTGAIAGISMLAVYDSHPAACVVMMMAITGCMFGVNLMLISRVPGHFAGRGNVSTVSGILNAATYVGSALSTYVFGAVAENTGWMAVVVLWGAAALGGTIFLLSGIRKWGSFSSAERSQLGR
ncbi:MAG: MFS transporter [Lachnospiraceae bacterium]|jgi:sugar phosphate permease|nr:MFS transporter [Lachnospiraceae bacterium]